MKKIDWMIVVIVLMVSSCSNENEEFPSRGGNAPIGFTTHLVQTKSGFVEDNFVDGDMMGVMGYELPQGSWLNDETPNVMYNVSLVRQTYNGVVNYVYNPLKMWPNSPSKMRFFAYYPHSSSVASGIITPSPAMLSGYPYVKLILGASPTPIDFMVAQTNEIDNGANERVALNFSHQLSKLKFMVKATGLETGALGGERKVYLTQLKIKNAFNKSVYVFDAGGGKWDEAQHGVEGVDAVSGATLKVSSVFVPIGTDWQDLIDPYGTGSYLLMIPQTSSHIELEVQYEIERTKAEGGCEDRIISTKRIPLSVDWKAGQVYTYYIEFAFSEIQGDNLKIGFEVADWNTKDIPTIID